MPTIKYGGKSGKEVKFVESKDLIAIRTRSQRPIGARSNVREPIESELINCELAFQFPEAGIEVYRMPAGEKKSHMESRKLALRAYPDVRFAGGVLVDPESMSPVLYTENLYVRFADRLDGDECSAAIRDAGLVIKEKLEFAVNAYFVQATEGTGQRVFDFALSLLARDDVEVCHPELVRPKSRKVFFPQQWHLAATTISGMAINQHAHVDAAHAVTRGAGRTIAIIDDGVDIDHAEFSSPGKIVAPLDALSRTSNPRPRDSDPRFPDDHGTACAGVACAAGVSGSAGVAPDSRLMPIRLAANLGSMAEARAFLWAADNGADVISCSWGPPDGDWFDPHDPRHRQDWPLPDSTRDAIHYAVTRGRGGLGCVVLFAAGNGNEEIKFDGYATNGEVIAVAACNDRGTRSIYSDFGDAVWCSFPSNDFAFPRQSHPAPLTTGIWTTDRTGGAGYNLGNLADGDSTGNYTNSFGGTSSACPGAAGVCALVLAVNPALTWIEVKELLRSSCDKIDASGGNYNSQGHSPKFGFGRINALRAVELAVPPESETVDLARSFAVPIPDQGQASVTLQVAESGLISDLAVHVEIEHTYIGDLVLILKSPGATGKSITLQSRVGGATRNLKQTYRTAVHAELAALRGQSINGVWTLIVQDRAARDVGVILSLRLQITINSSSQRLASQSTQSTVREPKQSPKSSAKSSSRPPRKSK